MGKELGEDVGEDFDAMVDESMEEERGGDGISGEDREESLSDRE